MTLQIVSGLIIPQGASLSNSIKSSPPGVTVFLGIIAPAAWDPAPLTFQWSFDNTTFYDIYDRHGAEMSLDVIPNSIVAIATQYGFYDVPYMKIRSGPRSSPIPQSADRAFSVLVQ